jgi:tRNA-specific 2-thiouridylase
LYVVRIDPATDTVQVGPREATLVGRTRVRSMNWLLPDVPARESRYQVKVRSTSKPVWCTLTMVSAQEARLAYDEPQAGVAPGQAAVLYEDDRVVGGGWIVGQAEGME